MSAFRIASSANPAAMDVDCSEVKSGGQANDNAATMPIDKGSANTNLTASNSLKPQRTPLPTSRPTPTLSSTQSDMSPFTKQVDLTRFDSATTKRIKELLQKLDYISSGDLSNKWYPEEDELLKLLRDEHVPYPCITSVRLQLICADVNQAGVC